MITNSQSGTRIDEVAPSIYRIATPAPLAIGGVIVHTDLISGPGAPLLHP